MRTRSGQGSSDTHPASRQSRPMLVQDNVCMLYHSHNAYVVPKKAEDALFGTGCSASLKRSNSRSATCNAAQPWCFLGVMDMMHQAH